MKKISNVTGVILAGGASSRFGTNKALATFESLPLIQHVARPLEKLFNDHLLITNTPESYEFLGWPMAPDIFSKCGPLGGIHAALHTIKTPRAFIVGCDMPLINTTFISYLCSLDGNWDVALPWLEAGPEPLHGVYKRTCLSAIEQSLKENQFKIGFLLRKLRIHKVDQDEIIDLIGDLSPFHNVNFNDDLLCLQEMTEKAANG